MEGPISAAQLGRVIVDAFDPVLSDRGFARIAGLKWVRSGGPEICHVIEAAPGRRGGRHVLWGISLDFVPHLVGDAVRWHRTATSARIDLGYDPRNFQDEFDFAAPAWTISPDLGAPTPAERARSIAAALPGTADPWFAAITDVGALPAAFEREAARPGGQFAFDDYVQHRLACAFTLARLGDRAGAEAEFERWAGREPAGPGTVAALRALLRETGPGGRAGG